MYSSAFITIKKLLTKEHVTQIFILTVFIVAFWIELGFLHLTSLRDEEAWVALTVLRNDIHTMIFGYNFHPRITPIGFLFILRWITDLFGASEFILRLPSALAAISTGWLGYSFSSKLFTSRLYGILFVILWNFNLTTLRLTKEVKQYGFDAFFSIALVYAFWLMYTNNQLKSAKAVTGFTILSFIAIFCSHPSIFVITAIILAWSIIAIQNKISLFTTALYAIITSGTFVLYYFLITRPNIAIFNTNHHDSLLLIHYLDLSYISQLFSLSVRLFSFFINNIVLALPQSSVITIVFICLFIIGFFKKIYNNYSIQLVIMLLFLIAISISTLGFYPYGGNRTNLYLAPLLIIMILHGVYALFQHIKIQYIPISLLTLFTLVNLVVAVNMNQAILVPMFQQNEIYLQYIQSNMQLGDTLVGCPSASLPIHYYAPTFQHEQIGGWDKYTMENHEQSLIHYIQTKQPERLWVLCTHYDTIKPFKNTGCIEQLFWQLPHNKISFLQMFDCSQKIYNQPFPYRELFSGTT